MFILRDLLTPLQTQFSETPLGRERASLFAYTLLSVIIPFTCNGQVKPGTSSAHFLIKQTLKFQRRLVA
jgi:hypothetical protein